MVQIVFENEWKWNAWYCKNEKQSCEYSTMYIWNEPEHKKLGMINAKQKQENVNCNSFNDLGSTMNIMLCHCEDWIFLCMFII